MIIVTEPPPLELARLAPITWGGLGTPFNMAFNMACFLLLWQVPKHLLKRVHTPAIKRLLKRLPKRSRECLDQLPAGVSETSCVFLKYADH